MATTDLTHRPREAWSVLIVSTLAFTVCFMVWMMFAVIGIPLKKTLGLNATEFGLLTAMPVLTGSLIRVQHILRKLIPGSRVQVTVQANGRGWDTGPRHGICACRHMPAAPTDDDAASVAPVATAPLRVLLIDDGAHHIGLIHEELTRQGHLVVGVVDSALLIHDCVLRLQPDVVIVDSESPTRDTLEHLGTVSARCPRPVVVFSADADAGPMQQALKAGVSAYVIDGLHPQRLLPVLQVAIARFEQDRALKGQLEMAQAQLSERKGVERAKGILMKEFGLSEEQAYAHLRKLAMDRGQKLATVAERVIDAQGLLRPPG